MIDISPITRLISALRAQTSANSITPEGLGSILQKIADLVGSLSLINTAEETNLITRVAQCESDCETARQAAQAAAANAAGNVISEVDAEQSADAVSITVSQESGNSFSCSIPAATTSLAGLLSATDKDHLDKAYQRTLYMLTTTDYEDHVRLNYERHNNQVSTVNFVGATPTTAGLMTAADKVALTTATSNITLLQTWKASVDNTLGYCARLNDETYKIEPHDLPPFLLYGMGGPDEGGCPIGSAYWDPETKQIWFRIQIRLFKPIEPSTNLVYRNYYTGKCYVWDDLEEVMVPITDQPTIVNDVKTGGANAVLAAQQGVVLHGETQLNEARYRNLFLAIKGASSLSALQSTLNAAGANTYYPLTLHLIGCTLLEEVPAYLGFMDSGTFVKVKAKQDYELSANSVQIYNGEPIQENEITNDFILDGIDYDAVSGLLTIDLADPAEYNIFITATLA